MSYNDETFDEVSQSLRTYYSSLESRKGAKNVRKSALTKSAEAVKALSLCHNVTPVYESSDVQVEATEADQDIQVNNFQKFLFVHHFSKNWTDFFTESQRSRTDLNKKCPYLEQRLPQQET